MQERKKLKDTKVGQFLKTNAPKVLDVVGDVLPDKGVLGIVKNLISKDDDIPEDVKASFEQELQAFELELKDIDSARNREIQIATSDATPFLNKIITPILALVIVGLTFILFYMVMFNYITSAEKDILMYVLGALTSYVGMVLTYYFGSSLGSRRKDESIKQLMQR